MYKLVAIFVLFLLRAATSLLALDKTSFSNSFPHNKIGLKNSRIENYKVVGGKTIPIEKAKYIGTVFNTYGNNSDFNGAGVILNNKWFLTVAFNISPGAKNVQVRLGSNLATEGGQEIHVENIIQHPKYEGNWGYDIALLKLSKKIKYTSKINVIKLGTKLPKDGEELIVSGFGEDEERKKGTLKQASVPFLDMKKCQPHYPEENLDTNICTMKEGVAPCSLDFGAPLIEKGKLIGLFAGANGCGIEDHPTVYVDVIKFRKWISDTIKKNSNPEELVELDGLEEITEEEFNELK